MKVLAVLLAAGLVTACNISKKFETDGDQDPDVTDTVDVTVEDVEEEEVEPDVVLPDDADGDTISDVDEDRDTAVDTDGDGDPDFEDIDTDGDTIPDAAEAGDSDLDTPPRDTDEDGIADFRDLDSDNDGLGDRWENDHGLDPYSEDTDGDGVPDLIEVGAGTDPTDPDSNPTSEGNFFFVIPYRDEPVPLMDTLVFSSEIQKADVFFLMDTTGSMGGAISNLQSGLSTTIIPQIHSLIPDVWFGVGRFDDYPFGTYGHSGTDVVFQLMQRMTGDYTAAQDGVNALDLHAGMDGPESHVPALWATATGNGLGTYLSPQTSCLSGELGYPCFRPDSIPIIVMFSDAPMHNGPEGANPYEGITPTPPVYVDAVDALNLIHAKVITIVNGGYGDAVPHAVAISRDTGAEDSSGNPLNYVIAADGTGLGTQVVNGVRTMAQQVPIDISAIARDHTGDTVDATRFIDSIVPNIVGGVADPRDATKICVGGLSTDDTDGDTTPDIFTDVLPGTTICFDIHPAENRTVLHTTEPQVFIAFIDVLGDGITLLDTRAVYFLVPPELPEP
jgi:hypothetical protein